MEIGNGAQDSVLAEVEGMKETLTKFSGTIETMEKIISGIKKSLKEMEDKSFKIVKKIVSDIQKIFSDKVGEEASPKKKLKDNDDDDDDDDDDDAKNSIDDKME